MLRFNFQNKKIAFLSQKSYKTDFNQYLFFGWWIQMERMELYW